MDHNLAAETHAVDRYLLGDMAAEERDAFEEHYFACVECAEEIRAGARFQANARQVLQESEPMVIPYAKPKRNWFSWTMPRMLPVAATLMLAGVVAYFTSNQSGPVPVYMVHAMSRGENVDQIPSGRGPFKLDFDLLVETPQPQYEITVSNAADKPVEVVTVPAPSDGKPVELTLNHSRYPAGRYTITVRAPHTPGQGGIAPPVRFDVK